MVKSTYRGKYPKRVNAIWRNKGEVAVGWYCTTNDGSRYILTANKANRYSLPSLGQDIATYDGAQEVLAS